MTQNTSDGVPEPSLFKSCEVCNNGVLKLGIGSSNLSKQNYSASNSHWKMVYDGNLYYSKYLPDFIDMNFKSVEMIFEPAILDFKLAVLANHFHLIASADFEASPC